MTIDGLEGRVYPPAQIDTTPERVGAFVTATGDDPQRWASHIPPSFAGAALFALVPDLLADDVVAGFPTIIHTEQSFRWGGPVAVGVPLSVEGKVESVRSRGPLHFVTFAAKAGDWFSSHSTFLLSSGDASSLPAEEEAEPPPDARGRSEQPAPIGRPEAGTIPSLAKSASRLDLVRYAAASGDFNPIHWDHGTAVRAGLPGVIVHGLLMAAWTCQQAARVIDGPAPLASLEVRFRRPLRPAAEAVVEATIEGQDPIRLRLLVATGDERLVTALALGAR